MKSIVIALCATLLVTGCLFSKKEEAPAEEAAPAAMEEAAPADAAPATEPAPAE